MTISTQCLMCRHYTGFSTCEAFPDKIPQEIFDGTFDHTEEYPGDNGIRFEEIKKPSVEKMIEIDITSLTKVKQQVRVKQTATRKLDERSQRHRRKSPLARGRVASHHFRRICEMRSLNYAVLVTLVQRLNRQLRT